LQHCQFLPHHRQEQCGDCPFHCSKDQTSCSICDDPYCRVMSLSLLYLFNSICIILYPSSPFLVNRALFRCLHRPCTLQSFARLSSHQVSFAESLRPPPFLASKILAKRLHGHSSCLHFCCQCFPRVTIESLRLCSE